MTEKKKKLFIFCFLLSIPEAHNSQSDPHVQWNRIQTGQRTDTRESEEKKSKRKSDKKSIRILQFLYLFNTL